MRFEAFYFSLVYVHNSKMRLSCEAMDINELKELAKESIKNAYAPQSGFKVGCAIQTVTGEVYTGCNVESLSLIFTICAERNAISTAIAMAGEIEIETVVVYTPTKLATPPCGACRQAIFEFGKNATIHCFSEHGASLTATIRELLPEAFDLKEME
jgi:cytidine deaminase